MESFDEINIDLKLPKYRFEISFQIALVSSIAFQERASFKKLNNLSK